MSQAVTPYLEMSQAIMEAGGEALKNVTSAELAQALVPGRR